MKKLLALGLVCVLCTLLWAQDKTVVTLDGTPFSVDTTEWCQVAPGTTRMTLKLNSETRQVVMYVLRADMGNEYTRLKAVKGKDQVTGLETVQSMATRMNAKVEGCEYVVGVNADYFYMTGFTSSACPTVVDGELYSADGNGTYVNAVCVDNTDAFYLGTVSQKIEMRATSIANTAVKYINRPITENGFAIYTSRCGSHTPNAGDGQVCEVRFRVPEGQRLEPGRGNRFVGTVEGAPSTAGGMEITDGCMVLAGYGTMANKVAALVEGNTVTVSTSMLIDGSERTGYELILCGLPMLLKNGQIAFRGDEIDHLPIANPRTLVGYGSSKKNIT
ncbi:MAG: hypothetical protein HUK03_07940, partial [Bacteroidaceae bacterium]|nr:hypothetical protein [Bacteroidaceae bacterium]